MERGSEWAGFRDGGTRCGACSENVEWIHTCPGTHSFNHPRIHALTRSLMYSLSHSRTHLLTSSPYSLPPTHSLSHPLVHPLTCAAAPNNTMGRRPTMSESLPKPTEASTSAPAWQIMVSLQNLYWNVKYSKYTPKNLYWNLCCEGDKVVLIEIVCTSTVWNARQGCCRVRSSIYEC